MKWQMVQFLAVQNSSSDGYLVRVPPGEQKPGDVALRFLGLHVLEMPDAFKDDFDLGNVDFDLYLLPESPGTECVQKLTRG